MSIKINSLIATLLFLLALFAFSKNVYATPSEDFFVSNFEAYYDEYANIQLANGDESMEGASCNIVDNSTSDIIDSGAIQTVSNQFQTFQGVVLSRQKSITPTNWNPQSTYYLECTKLDNSIVTSNDIRYMVAPTIVNAVQNGNLIDIYFSPSLETYTPNVENGFNLFYSLYSTEWFDSLGMQQPLINCEDGVIYNSQTLSVCHFNLQWNPQLPSSSTVQIVMEYYDEVPFGQERYISKSSNYISITTIAPEISPLEESNITEGDSYIISGAFTDINSSSFSAIIDYGEGNGYEPFVLDGNNFTINHQYNSAGTYLLQLSIQDDDGVYGSTFATVTVEEASGPNEPVTLYPTQDAYIMQGSKNENEGGSEILRLQSSGKNRAIIQFDQNEIEEAIGDSQNFSVKLVYTITDNGNNWGNEGRTIDLHRLTGEWLEGNGNGSYRGEGSGATWNCGIDDNINNQANDCSSSWEMTNESEWPFINNPSSATLIENNQEGEVQLDVTSDIQGFINNSYTNYGWLLKKTNEGQNGRVEFGSRETSNSPRLVISFE